MTKVKIEFKQVSDLIDSKYKLIKEVLYLKELINELHKNNVKLQNKVTQQQYELHDLSVEKEQNESSVTLSSVQAEVEVTFETFKNLRVCKK